MATVDRKLASTDKAAGRNKDGDEGYDHWLFGDAGGFDAKDYAKIGQIGADLVGGQSGGLTEGLGYATAIASGNPLAIAGAVINDITGNFQAAKQAKQFQREAADLREKGKEVMDKAIRQGKFQELEGLHEKQENVLRLVNAGFSSGEKSFGIGTSARSRIESNKNVAYANAKATRDEGQRIQDAYEKQAKAKDEAAKAAKKSSGTWGGLYLGSWAEV